MLLCGCRVGCLQICETRSNGCGNVAHVSVGGRLAGLPCHRSKLCSREESSGAGWLAIRQGARCQACGNSGGNCVVFVFSRSARLVYDGRHGATRGADARRGTSTRARVSMVERTVIAAERHEFTSYNGCNVRTVKHFTGNWSAIVWGEEAIRSSCQHIDEGDGSWQRVIGALRCDRCVRRDRGRWGCVGPTAITARVRLRPPTGSVTRVRTNVKSRWRGQESQSRNDKGREMGKYDSKGVA